MAVARNRSAGTIEAGEARATTTHVMIEVSPTVTTRRPSQTRHPGTWLKAGMKATAVIKASDVMVGV